MTNSRLKGLGIAMAAAAAVVLAAPSIEAYPDAKVETQTRPDFGLLLRPPLRRKPHRPRPYRGDRYRPGDHGYPYGHDRYPPHDGPLRPVALVDCSDARSPNDVNRALASLEPGGTLILRTAPNQGCLDGVRIFRPVTIMGDGGQIWSPRGSRRHLRPDRDESYAIDDEQFAPPAADAAVPPSDDPALEVFDDEDANEGRHIGTGDRRADDFVGLDAHLKTRPGQVCIDIAPGAGRVVLRNLVISQREGGEAPCIFAENADLSIENSVIRYIGSGSAIHMEGGKLSISQDSLVDATTFDRAIYAERTLVDLSDFTLTGEPAVGLELVGPQKGSDINDVEFYSRSQAQPFATSSTGIVISAANGLGELDISRSRICGFNIGVWQSGANDTRIRRGLICGSIKGIVAAGGKMTVEGTTIGAQSVGVQIGAANPVTLNALTIYGVKYADIFVEPGGVPPQGSGHYYYSYVNPRCTYVELDGRHADYQRYRRTMRRSGRMYYMPGGSYFGGVCSDPSRLDPRYIGYERRLGYDTRGYALQPWNDPDHYYHLAHPEFGIDGRPLPAGAPPP